MPDSLGPSGRRLLMLATSRYVARFSDGKPLLASPEAAGHSPGLNLTPGPRIPLPLERLCLTDHACCSAEGHRQPASRSLQATRRSCTPRKGETRHYGMVRLDSTQAGGPEPCPVAGRRTVPGGRRPSTQGRHPLHRAVGPRGAQSARLPAFHQIFGADTPSFRYGEEAPSPFCVTIALSRGITASVAPQRW
jgi:hypothetical protein